MIGELETDTRETKRGKEIGILSFRFEIKVVEIFGLD